MRPLLISTVIAIAAAVGSLAADKPGGWGPLEQLIGDWTGEGGGGPGQGSGAFSFKPDLQGKILIRKNRASYPAVKDRPASVHEDLMIVYRDAADAPLRAIYFDSEGHTIRYDVQAVQEDEVAFVSRAEAAAPRYRLTYKRNGAETVKIKFEIAPPGHPEEFATYIEAAARRDPK